MSTATATAVLMRGEQRVDLRPNRNGASAIVSNGHTHHLKLINDRRDRVVAYVTVNGLHFSRVRLGAQSEYRIPKALPLPIDGLVKICIVFRRRTGAGTMLNINMGNHQQHTRRDKLTKQSRQERRTHLIGELQFQPHAGALASDALDGEVVYEDSLSFSDELRIMPDIEEDTLWLQREGDQPSPQELEFPIIAH